MDGLTNGWKEEWTDERRSDPLIESHFTSVSRFSGTVESKDRMTERYRDTCVSGFLVTVVHTSTAGPNLCEFIADMCHFATVSGFLAALFRTVEQLVAV
jgi:hypothetical protein